MVTEMVSGGGGGAYYPIAVETQTNIIITPEAVLIFGLLLIAVLLITSGIKIKIQHEEVKYAKPRKA